jgi:hypothetical protein
MLRRWGNKPLRTQELLSESRPRNYFAAWRASSIIVGITGCYLAAGLFAFLAWQFTGNIAWAVEFFQVPAALVMVWLALLQLSLSLKVTANFAPDDLLRPGWMLITASAGCQFVGSLLSQVLGVNSRLNPLALVPRWRESLIPELRHVGLTFGGTLRFALLSVGLLFAVKAYRQSGLLSRLRAIDWAVLTLMAVYLARNVVDVAVAIRQGKHPDAWELLNWPTDPLLGLLLAQGLLLFRSAQRMGSGMVGRCWKAFAIGLFLTALGDLGLWAINYGYLPGPWQSLAWYVWLPAAAAFACAPAFQLEMIRHAAIGSASPATIDAKIKELSF